MRWRRADGQRALHRHDLTSGQRQAVWAICGALLDYPTAELVAGFPQLRSTLAELPVTYQGWLGGRLPVMERDLLAAQAEYVATFDHTRKRALYLTYFGYGDTRRRGVALVQFKQTYRRSGVVFDDSDGELPDHLCAVLQFGALVDHDAAWQLLLEHRAGVEMLRIALNAKSPWLGVLEALCSTLPPLRGDEADAIRRLIERGPPAEEVGLQPYSIDPMIAGASIPVGAPAVRVGARGTRS